jgi:hypothetical protein
MNGGVEKAIECGSPQRESVGIQGWNDEAVVYSLLGKDAAGKPACGS